MPLSGAAAAGIQLVISVDTGIRALQLRTCPRVGHGFDRHRPSSATAMLACRTRLP